MYLSKLRVTYYCTCVKGIVTYNYIASMCYNYSSLNCVDTIITECTPVIGAHTGPGLIGVIVSKLDRDIADLFI